MLNNPEIANGQNIFLQQHCAVVDIGMVFIQVTYIYRITFAFENPQFWKQFTTKCIKKVPFFLQHLPPTAWYADMPNRV